MKKKCTLQSSRNMADMIAWFVAVVDVGKFFLAVNPYFDEVGFSRSLCVNNIIDKKSFKL